MRPDMKKVIVARTKSGTATRVSGENKRSRITDESPYQEGLKDSFGYKTKNSDGLYGPIKRFLESKLGSKWDDVWSEVCQNSKDDLGRILRERIGYYVSIKCQIIDGEVMTINSYRCHLDYYVHPKTNILTKNNKTWKKTRHKKVKNQIIQMNGLEYYCHEDIWYRIRTAEYVPTETDRGRVHYNQREEVPDVFGVKTVNQLNKIYGCPKFVIWKQQANSKECKKLKELEKLIPKKIF